MLSGLGWKITRPSIRRADACPVQATRESLGFQDFSPTPSSNCTREIVHLELQLQISDLELQVKVGCFRALALVHKRHVRAAGRWLAAPLPPSQGTDWGVANSRPLLQVEFLEQM